MKRRFASLIGVLVGGSLLWIASKGGFEAAKSPGDAAQMLEGKTQARGSRADSLEGIHDILAGRRPLPGKFEELEKLARGLTDIEIRSLLDQRQDAGVEDPWTWVRCALWSIVGERADGLDGMPEKPSAVPEEISGEEYMAANLRAECLAMDWASFLRGFSRKEPGRSWTELAEQPDLRSCGGYAGDEILAWAVEEVFANWAESNPEQAHRAILDRSGDGRATTAVEAVAGFHLGVPSGRRTEFLADLYNIAFESGLSHAVGMHGVVAGVWARSEPDAAWAWLKEHFPADRKLPVEYALGFFLSAWAQEPESLYRWCETADAANRELLGDRPIDRLLYRRPCLAAALVENGWEMKEPPDWEGLVRSRRAFSPNQPVNLGILQEPWSDWKLTDEQWRSDFRQAMPVFGVPEDVQKELLEALDQYLIKGSRREGNAGE
jgi:hypothetical protein